MTVRSGWSGIACALVVALAGCSLTPVLPPEPTAADREELRQERLDALWARTKLADDLRPPASTGTEVNYFAAPKTFARCMQERGWTEFYFEYETGYGYRALQLATTDGERLDWYECFASLVVTNSPSLGSIAEYDFVYDYYEQSLIPCLRQHGFEVRSAPTRLQFRSLWIPRYDPLYTTVWNPFYDLPGYSGPNSLPVAGECAPEPPGQTFYELR